MPNNSCQECTRLKSDNARLVEKVKEQNTQINNLVLENGIVGAAIHVYQGGEVSDFMESMGLVDEARQHMAKNDAQAEQIKRLREAIQYTLDKDLCAGVHLLRAALEEGSK